MKLRRFMALGIAFLATSIDGVAAAPFTVTKIFESGGNLPMTTRPVSLPQNAQLTATGATGIIDDLGGVALRINSNWPGVATIAFWDGQDDAVQWTPFLTTNTPLPPLKTFVTCGGASWDRGIPEDQRQAAGERTSHLSGGCHNARG